MRPSTVLLALPALAVAAEQQPLLASLKGLWNKVAENIPTTIPNPVDAGASKVAEHIVTDLNETNWKDNILGAAPTATGEPTEFLLFITGGKKTCYGLCGNVTTEWNKAAAQLLAQQKTAPRLAQTNCDEEGSKLCALLQVNPPAIYHFLVSPGAGDPVSRYYSLNSNNSTAQEIVELSTKRKFEEVKVYTGLFEPFTGQLAQLNLQIPFMYAAWAVGQLPSWAPMVLISLVSRTFMGRAGAAARRPAPPGAAAPAAGAGN